MTFNLYLAKQLVPVFELLAAVTGFVYWKKIRRTHYQWLPVYLAAIVLLEMASILIDNTKAVSWNIYLFKFIGFPLQFLFFTWFFYRERRPKNRYWYLVAAIGYLLSVFIEELLLQRMRFPFFSFSYMVGCIVLLIHCLLFFNHLLRSDALLNYKNSLSFWVCLGVIVFYIGTFPFYGLFNTLATKKYQHIHLAYNWIACFLDYAMYLLFIVGFRCYRPKQK
jgi:hypothetical protein